MNTTCTTGLDTFCRTAERLARVGLVVDHTELSREQRRAFFALQCLAVNGDQHPVPRRPLIGFAYPNTREG